ncbi:hypothetical protein JSQ81_15830 [Sporosarcina sp. Marseille-Q4063]|uniref:hypothetical protein n=1 Tax=Sporosarcina sp. Marseille-Q4063 TaxID=2810514 RepID=UPI001BB07772|nr:hypothetical protein [Sporosarcina sp. Marseille-Q4063]QUW21262.1 hypothetical protein JSQ81_15830 [Sporosarcina sp. Marseille-Q4063]
MIPSEVENRIARYFFYIYLPEEVMLNVEEKLLNSCVLVEDENLNHDELVNFVIDIIAEQLEGKKN